MVIYAKVKKYVMQKLREIKKYTISMWKNCLQLLRRMAQRVRSEGSAAIAFIKKKASPSSQKRKRRASRK